MTVAELIEELSKLDREAVIILSKGSDYSPYSDFSTGMYYAGSTHSGHFASDGDPEEQELCREGDYSNSGQRCVVLWPTD